MVIAFMPTSLPIGCICTLAKYGKEWGNLCGKKKPTALIPIMTGGFIKLFRMVVNFIPINISGKVHGCCKN